MMKVLLIAVAAVVLFAGTHSQAMLTFPKYETPLPEYYYAGDFKDPAACEEARSYWNARLPGSAHCDYVLRAKVWWLMAQNIALVQAPNLASLF